MVTLTVQRDVRAIDNDRRFLPTLTAGKAFGGKKLLVVISHEGDEKSHGLLLIRDLKRAHVHQPEAKID